ncbi:MAG: glycosyltransferase family 39 protein [Nanoarchaeota archaeon]|nr:glycosyltransferase family 39 protein [DPANN group archaeon]MBL7116649.1 glycosyltransferase family 39 protein [Nanoarchaeota archaeon]
MAKRKTDDEFSFDLSTVKSLFKKISFGKNKVWLSILLILIAMYFSIHFRMYSYYLPVTDDWAYNNIYNSVRAQVANQINQQYPNLPAPNKNRLIDEQVADFFNQQGSGLNSQIRAISFDLKSRFKDESGQTYLLAIDPYVYFMQARNFIDHGYVGDILVNGRSFNTHVIAPLGSFTRTTFHPIFEAYFHKFMSIFTNNSLMKNVFFVPILLSALSVIPAFFLAKRRVGYFGGFIAAMIVAVHSAFLGRTAGGFADTDAYNVLFPLLIAWVFIEAFESDNWKKQIPLLALAGFFIGLYSFAWSGWWYIFDFLLVVVLAYTAYLVVKSVVQTKSFRNLWTKELRNSITVLILFVVFSGIFVSLFLNFANFEQFIKGPISFKVLKQVAKPNLWPNVYTTVAELNPASISSIIGQIGGKFFFFIAGLGVILTMIKRDNINKRDFILLGLGSIVYLLLITKTFIGFSPIKYIIIFLLPLIIGLLLLLKDKRKVDVKYALFLTIWFVGTIYASTKGTRFVLLMVPAFGIAFGIALGTIQSILSDLVAREFKVNKRIISAVLIALLLLLLVNPIKGADRTAKGEIPSMNDAWWNTLTKIKNNSSEDAIITSWWDFGHWFKSIADRSVTFDGGSQNRPQAHWVGKILMNDDEEQAIGILRMLDCGANNAFDEINKKYDDTEISVDIVYDIIMMEQDEVALYLKEKGFDDDAINNVTMYTHCDPSEAFFITSGDMVGKAGVWSHFGSWNFDRSFIYNNVKKADYQEAINLLTDRFNITEEAASNYYYEVQSLTSDQQVNNWIAPWPNYATPNMRGCKNTSEIAECDVSLGIGQSNLGQNVRISKAIINLSDPVDTRFILSFIDRNTGLAVAQQETKPRNVIIADEDFRKYDAGGGDIALDLVYDRVTNRALVTHPSLSQSLFTRLFYLDGRYTTHFEKFSDLTSVSGSRILVWKVDWNPILENE